MKGMLPDAAAMWQHPAANSGGRPNNNPQLSMGSNTNMYMRNRMQTSTGCSSTNSAVAKQQDPFSLLMQEPPISEQAAPANSMLNFHHSHINLTLPDKLQPANQTLLGGPFQGPSDSSPQADQFASSMDWINDTYAKILKMKEMYLGELILLHKRTQEMMLRATNDEILHKVEKSKLSIERMIAFLTMPASDLLRMGSNRANHLMATVLKYVQHCRASNSLHPKQTPPQLDPSEVPSHHIQQRDSYQMQNLRQGALPFNPFKIGPSVGLQKLVEHPSSIQYNQMRHTQQWGNHQQGLSKLLHNSVNNTSQQPVVSSRNMLDYSMAQMAPIPLPPMQNDPGIKRQKMKQQMMVQKWNTGGSQRWNPVLPPGSSPHTMISPHISQQSFDIKDLSTKFSKSKTPSPCSPPSPSITSSNPADSVKTTISSNLADSVKSPLQIEESSKFARTSQLLLPDKIPTQVSADTQILTKSCMNSSESVKQSLQDKGSASKRLVEVVKKMSSSALNATLRDVNAVTTLTDRTAGEFLNGDPTKLIFHNLADEVNNEISSYEDGVGLKTRMKRELDAEVLNDSITEMEFYAKRLKNEPNNLLLQNEIQEINKKLIEVVVEDVSRELGFEGTLIRCSYIPIGLLGNINTSTTSKQMFPSLLLDLIVNADYPNSSPIVSEKTPSCFRDGDEGKHLWMKAKSSFSLSVKELPEPISVKEMAEIWNVCARDAFRDFAEQMGGGDFSSTYGKWENCAVAV